MKVCMIRFSVIANKALWGGLWAALLSSHCLSLSREASNATRCCLSGVTGLPISYHLHTLIRHSIRKGIKVSQRSLRSSATISSQQLLAHAFLWSGRWSHF